MVACYGKGALHKAFDIQNNVYTMFPHFDILGGIHHLRKGFKYSMLIMHVKDHQDRHNPKNINRLDMLSIERDLRAKLYWRDI